MARTPRVIEDRRAQILDAAVRVFARKGFTRATNRDIAHEAGITTGLIYYYFTSKDALLQAIIETRSPINIFTHITPEILAQPPEIFLPLILARALGVLEGQDFLDMIRVILPETLHDGHAVPAVMEIVQRVTGFLRQYLQHQIELGNLSPESDLDMLAQIIVSSITGFVLRRQIIGDPSLQHLTHDEIARSLTSTFLQGVQRR